MSEYGPSYWAGTILGEILLTYFIYLLTKKGIERFSKRKLGTTERIIVAVIAISILIIPQILLQILRRT